MAKQGQSLIPDTLHKRLLYQAALFSSRATSITYSALFCLNIRLPEGPGEGLSMV